MKQKKNCAIDNCNKPAANKDKYCHTHRSRIKKHGIDSHNIYLPVKANAKGANNSQYKHGLRHHRLYKVWLAMKDRCSNKNNKSYVNYGAKGVTVCDLWKRSASEFINWSINNGWKRGLQIDRINNDGDYSPGNCRFVTINENVKNRRLIQKSNKTGYCGVSKINNRYRARVGVNGRCVLIAVTTTAIEAAVARDRYVIANNLGLPLNFTGEKHGI